MMTIAELTTQAPTTTMTQSNTGVDETGNQADMTTAEEQTTVERLSGTPRPGETHSRK